MPKTPPRDPNPLRPAKDNRDPVRTRPMRDRPARPPEDPPKKGS